MSVQAAVANTERYLGTINDVHEYHPIFGANVNSWPALFGGSRRNSLEAIIKGVEQYNEPAQRPFLKALAQGSVVNAMDQLIGGIDGPPSADFFKWASNVSQAVGNPEKLSALLKNPRTSNIVPAPASSSIIVDRAALQPVWSRSASPSGDADKTYTVVPGDNLSKIALEHDLDRHTYSDERSKIP